MSGANYPTDPPLSSIDFDAIPSFEARIRDLEAENAALREALEWAKPFVGDPSAVYTCDGETEMDREAVDRMVRKALGDGGT